MKWQCNYKDIPFDTHHTHPVAIQFFGEVRKNQDPDDLRGPHNNREMMLMLTLRKPCASLQHKDIGFWADTILREGWYFKRIAVKRRTGQVGFMYIVTLRGCEWRAYRLERVYNDAQRRGGMKDVDHARVGFLLGYTKECIKYFLANFQHHDLPHKKKELDHAI